MAKLLIPQADANGQLAPANVDKIASNVASGAAMGDTQRTAGASAAAQGAGIGSVMMQAAKDLQNRSQQYFNEAQASFNDSIFNDTYSKATQEYNQQVLERMNKTVDENGNPTFATLNSDISQIGQSISDKYGQGLTNPDVRARFNSQFNNIQTARLQSAGEHSRDQQNNFAISSLTTNLTQSVNNSVADPINRDMYFTQASNAIDEGVKAGYINPLDAVKAKEKLRSDTYKGSIESLNLVDPKSVQDILKNNTPEDLKLNHNEYRELFAKNQTALYEFHDRAVKIQKEQEQIKLQSYNLNAQDAAVGIAKGQITPLGVQTLYDKGQINHKQWQVLTEKALTASGVSAKEAATLTAITGDLASGTNLSQYSSSDINKHYEQSIGLASGNGQQPLSIMQKAQIASKYNAPVPGFDNEIKAIVLGEKDPAKVVQAVQAMDFATTQSPRLAEGVDKQTLGIVSLIALQTKGTNQDSARVVQNARDAVMNIDPSVREFRATHFSEQDKFKAANLEDTINSTIKSDIPGRSKIQPDLLPMYNGLLKEAYNITGNDDAAIKMVQNWTAGTVGTTKVNNTPGFFRDKQTAMLFPPEKVLPQYTPEEVRANLNQSVAGLLVDNPHMPAGLKPDEVFIGSDQTTRQDLKNPSYQLYFLDKDGNKQMVLDKNGLPQHYVIDATERAKMDQAKEDALRVQHESALQGNQGQKDLQNRKLDDIFRSSRTSSSVLDLAQKYVGLGEIKDKAILSQTMSKMLGQGIDPSRTPWCAAFVNTMLQANGIKGSGSLTAVSFLQWGRPTSTPQAGDVVVTQPMAAGMTGHVGLFSGYEYQNGHRMVKILAGNAGDKVAYQLVPEAAVRGYRQPPSVSELQTDPTMQGVMKMASGNPRGLRNNNPGNLEKTPQQWEGEVQGKDPRFKTFATPEDGIRGIQTSLLKKVDRGLDTVNKIISSYAPSFENDTKAYITDVSKTLGIDPNTPLDLKNNTDLRAKFIGAMINHENGKNPFGHEKIKKAITADASKFAAPPNIPHEVYEDVARGLDKGRSSEA